MSCQSRDFLQEGIDLFNAGRYFECHEAWEEVWKRARGDEKIRLQGLIQAAVAILHAERGNLEGAASLYSKALDKLESTPDRYFGLEIADLREALRLFFGLALRGRGAELPQRPQITRYKE